MLKTFAYLWLIGVTLGCVGGLYYMYQHAGVIVLYGLGATLVFGLLTTASAHIIGKP